MKWKVMEDMTPKIIYFDGGDVFKCEVEIICRKNCFELSCYLNDHTAEPLRIFKTLSDAKNLVKNSLKEKLNRLKKYYKKFWRKNEV